MLHGTFYQIDGVGRGRISIVDAKGLQDVSCDCYARIERRYEELLGPLD